MADFSFSTMFSGFNPSVALGISSIILVMIVALIFSIIILFYLYDRFMRYNIPVFIVYLNQGGIGFGFDRGWMNTDKVGGRRVFRLYKENIRLYNVDPAIHGVSNRWIPLLKFGQTNFVPLLFRYEGEDPMFVGKIAANMEWILLAAKREIEKRKNGNWIMQNIGMIVGMTFCVVVLIVFYLCLGKLDALQHLDSLDKIGPNLAKAAENFCKVQNIPSPVGQ